MSRLSKACYISFTFWVLNYVIVPPSYASSLETFVLTVGGQSTVGPNFQCATFGAPAPVFAFFGANGVSIPTDGLATCGIQGGFRTTTSPTGPLSDATGLNTQFNGNLNSFTGTASANAQYGKVGAKAHSEFTGPQNGLIVEGAEGYGLFRETRMVPNSPNVSAGTAGMVRFQFTVDGSLSVMGPPQFSSISDVEVRYQQNNDPIFTLMRAQVPGANSMPFISSATGTGLSGFTLAPGSVIGSGIFDTFQMPIVFGTPFDFTLGLLAYTIPGTGGVNDANFLASAELTGIQLFAGGQPVTTFAITSDSGTVYGPNGVQAVPEPLTILGAGTAAGFGAFFKRELNKKKKGQKDKDSSRR